MRRKTLPERLTARASAVASAALLVPLAAGCGDTDDTGDRATGSLTDPLYAMMIQVYDPDDRTVYVSLSDTLDVMAVDLGEAREFPGVANFAAFEGRLLVSSGSEPEITEFEITPDYAWQSTRRKLNFGNYGLKESAANFYGQFIIDSEHAMLPFEDGTRRIIWNPSEMVIETALEDSKLTPAEPNLTLECGGNRNAVHFDDGVMLPCSYHDDDWYHFGSVSHAIVYDADTFEEERILDLPCPELAQMTRDEQGNTYFSNWSLPSTSITGEAPPMCIAKVGPERDAFETIDLAEWTSGRIANNFRYIGGGKATANVLHHELLGYSTPSEIDQETLLGDELWSGPQWKLWLFDMEEQTAAPIEGIEIPLSAWSQFSTVEGRTFVFLPYDDDARTKAYELLADGTAVEHFDTLGDVFKWVRVR